MVCCRHASYAHVPKLASLQLPLWLYQRTETCVQQCGIVKIARDRIEYPGTFVIDCKELQRVQYRLCLIYS